MKNEAHWHFVSLEKVADVQTGLSKSSSRRGDSITLPYLRVANVQDGHFDLSEVKEIEVPANSVERYQVRSGDVLLTEGGDFDKLGRGAVWRGQIETCVHQNHVFVVRPHRRQGPQQEGAHAAASQGQEAVGQRQESMAGSQAR